MAEYELDRSLAQDTWKRLDAFTRGYITAAMWTLTGEDGESLDYLGLHDIADETIEKAIVECKAFRDANHANLELTGNDDDEQLGHDFWLTRNRHGAGFWDRGYDPIVARQLTDAAHACGTADWYVGDDGYVYQM